MGSGQYRLSSKIICVLCQNSDENEITGALSSKENISAHQNCLLYASGIYCKNSPTYDDLFGFAVDDVKKELRRGKRLQLKIPTLTQQMKCSHCGKPGATAGCDVKHCKHSFHYPCAIEVHGRPVEDRAKGSYILFCKKHDPQTKRTSSVNGSSTSSPNPPRCGSADIHGRKFKKSKSSSSTGSSEVELPRPKKRKSSVVVIDSDDENQSRIDSMFVQVESDLDDSTPPKQHNSTPVAENTRFVFSHGRPCEELSTSTTTDPVNRASTSGLNHTTNGGSADRSGQLHGRSELYLPTRSPEVETPRKKKAKLTCKKFLAYSDDEIQSSTDPVVVLEKCTPPKQHKSTPVPENTRSCEEFNPSTTEADGDDIDSDVSQCLLPSDTYHVTVPCTIIMDSGSSMESETGLEPSSPSIPAAVCTSPGSVVASKHGEMPPTKITSLESNAPTTNPHVSGSADPTPHQDHSSDVPSCQPGSPNHSSSIASIPAALPSAIQPLPASDITTDHLPELSHPQGASTPPDCLAAADACSVDAMASSESSATIFWARCNEAGCIKEIFSDILSQLSSLGERVHTQEASHKDYNVALKVLEASGRLPRIITQLERDLEKQEQDLQRKKAALRDARAVLGVQNLI
ncbi:uncharacterized protein LOC127446799 isoform X3 [Myxocyprinus asiaticus]|uniref:uncharacterized protein LOC127446799 isoform X3 n=1 Tax=Myxocyprinus asiaticus TaxID=70543 RepID=UPI00222217A6|nr:uncharacterized protein LOC127446799 isoform X3 [Myxocyprinus asiaticus]